MAYEYREFHRRRLPHIHSPGATLFLTFRLADSVPKPVLAKWKSERQLLELETKRKCARAIETATSEDSKIEEQMLNFRRRWFAKFEEVLHKAEHGPTWLKDPRIAQLVVDSLHHRDGEVYRLNTFCIMSNHVHVLFRPFLNGRNLRERPTKKGLRVDSDRPPLDAIMHSLKSFTANEANKLLRRTGRFWEAESYDHIVRNEEEYWRIRSYILNNPVKAKLVESWRDWRWNWTRE